MADKDGCFEVETSSKPRYWFDIDVRGRNYDIKKMALTPFKTSMASSMKSLPL